MAKAVLISIRPEWVARITSGKKTLEVRKNRPKLELPFKCYIYETQGRTETPWIDEDGHTIFKGRGHVAGEFVCDTYVTDKTFGHDTLFNAAACMNESDVVAYSAGTPLYGWHISGLKVYDNPLELTAFRKPELPTGLRYEDDAIRRPPQSWCYVEELK